MSSSINYVFTLVEDDIPNREFRVNYAYSSVAFSSFSVFWLKYFTGNEFSLIIFYLQALGRRISFLYYYNIEILKRLIYYKSNS